MLILEALLQNEIQTALSRNSLVWNTGCVYDISTLVGSSSSCAISTDNDNEGILHTSQISKIGASPSDCLMSYPGHQSGAGGGGGLNTVEMQSVYFTAPVD